MRAPDEMRDLEPHLGRVLHTLSEGIQRGCPRWAAARFGEDWAWAKSLAAMTLTEAEKELTAAFIDQREAARKNLVAIINRCGLLF